MLSEEETYETLKRLKNLPTILESLKGILDITEGAKGIEKADDAEFALIPEVRGLGKNSSKTGQNIKQKRRKLKPKKSIQEST